MGKKISEETVQEQKFTLESDDMYILLLKIINCTKKFDEICSDIKIHADGQAITEFKAAWVKIEKSLKSDLGNLVCELTNEKDQGK